MKRNDIAFVVGHDQIEQGAYSDILSMTEYEYNCKVANLLCNDFDIYYRDTEGGYNEKMTKLAKQVNPKKYDFVIELHFNKFNAKVQGCEAVIYPDNVISRSISNDILNSLVLDFNSDNRGVKEHYDGDRGFGFLSKMNANAIILEPFFGDTDEAQKFADITKYVESIKKTL